MDAQHTVMNLHFEKASEKHIQTIFAWLAEPHMQEFWDNSQEHKDDILNFIHGRPQHYFEGASQYWVGYANGDPYAFILSDMIKPDQENLLDMEREFLSKDGTTVCLDFGIGNTEFLGKGLGALTLDAFMQFYRCGVDPCADTFWIDPDENNPRAIYVYKKAGFKRVGQFDVTRGAFIGHKSDLMVRKFSAHMPGKNHE